MAMTSIITQPWREKLPKYMFTADAVTPPVDLYLAAFTGSPGVDGNSVSEMPNAGGYARLSIGARVVFSGGAIGIDQNVLMDEATADWAGLITYWAICESGTYGANNLIAIGKLSHPRTVTSGDRLRFEASDVAVYFSSKILFAEGVEKALKWLFSSASQISEVDRPTEWWMSLWLALPVSTGDAEITGNEISGTGYVRKSITMSVSSGIVSFSTDVSWGTLAANWGDMSYFGIHSGETGGGNGIAMKSYGDVKIMSAGDSFAFLASGSVMRFL